MTKCANHFDCDGEPLWSMQPFGPDTGISFALIGNHYRGFPVVKLCDGCKEMAEEASTGESPFFFRFKGKTYRIDGNGVGEVFQSTM